MAESHTVTNNSLLDGRVSLRQHAAGYRVSVDPVLLAASIPAKNSETILDVGAGVGAAMLCLAQRVDSARIIGVEIQRDLVHLASENISNNGFSKRLEIMIGDLQRPPPRLVPRSFDHVMANPPYFEAGHVRESAKLEKVTSNIEGAGGLSAWINYCLSMVRPGGTVTIIHRTDRLVKLLTLLDGKVGDIVIFPIWPHHPFPFSDENAVIKEANENIKIPVNAKRVIVQAISGTRGLLQLRSGIVLHNNDGHNTLKADAILRHGKALNIREELIR